MFNGSLCIQFKYYGELSSFCSDQNSPKMPIFPLFQQFMTKIISMGLIFYNYMFNGSLCVHFKYLNKLSLFCRDKNSPKMTIF